MGNKNRITKKMNNNIIFPEDIPDTSKISTEEDSQNYWRIYREWKAIAFVITKEQFENLKENNRQTVKEMLIKISKQGIPMTPRLAGMALADRNKAKSQVELLG